MALRLGLPFFYGQRKLKITRQQVEDSQSELARFDEARKHNAVADRKKFTRRRLLNMEKNRRRFLVRIY